MIAITFALAAESADFIRLLQDREPAARGTAAAIVGSLHNQPICVVHTGVGEKIARAQISKFIAEAKPALLISSGFAGASTDELKPGDVMLAENFCAPDLLAIARSAFLRTNVRVGKLATAAAVIDTIMERETLARNTGALAIDMETEAIAQRCAEVDIPMLSLRAITDAPAFPFPAPPQVLFDVEHQKTIAPRLALYLATHPFAIGRLLAFAKRVSAARASLAATLDLLLRSESLAAAASSSHAPSRSPSSPSA
jgi:adenosylhomocysteine nucleosidase